MSHPLGIVSLYKCENFGLSVVLWGVTPAGEILKSESVANPRHLDKSVEKNLVRCILPHLEAEKDDVLIEVSRRFENFEE
jgi:hypothetical protein